MATGMNLIEKTKILTDYGRYETCLKFQNTSENVAVNKFIVPFKGRVIIKQHTPKNCKRFSINIFKLCD
jgi:hypothetical protein